MKKLIFTFLTIFVFSQTHAQVGIEDVYKRFQNDQQKSFTKITDYSQIKGSPYYYKDYKESELFLSKNQTYKIKLKYNIYSDEFEFERDKIAYNVPKEKVDSIKIGNETFVCQSVKEKSTLKSYYIKLNDGKYKLLVKKNIVFSPKDKVEPYKEQKPDRFEPRKDELYLSTDNGNLFLITNKKTIQESIPALNDKITAYSKEHNLKLTKKEDIIQLFNYLNKNK
jgi:hypothetical protein